MMALRAKIFEYKDQKIRRRTQKTFIYGPNNMEPLNIPYIADTKISGGTFQTPILQNITHGQRNNSRLWHIFALIKFLWNIEFMISTF